MNTNEKKALNVKRLLISLLILVIVAVFAVILGVFDGIKGLLTAVTISRNTIVKLLLALAVVFFSSNLLLFILGMFQDKKGRAGTLSTVMSSIVKYISALAAFCWGLSIIGVNVSTIFASVGIVALIVGFGAESLVADLVTGVFILFENEYNVGDVLEVGGFRGTVTEIGIRTVSITDSGGNVKIINNSGMQNVINRSNQKSVAVCDIGVAYSTDLEELEKKLPDIFKEIENKYGSTFDDGINYSGVETLGDSSMTLRFTAVVDEREVFSARRKLNKEFKIAFDREHIEIPFPQMDVHTR